MHYVTASYIVLENPVMYNIQVSNISATQYQSLQYQHMQYTKNKKYYGAWISIFARLRIYFSHPFPLCLTVIVRPIDERGSTRSLRGETSQRFHLSVVS